MAKAYTPGLKVAASTAYQAHRVLPIPGTLRVAAGDVVEADTIVAETFMDGDITPLNVANLLSAQPGDIPQLMLKQEGDAVEKDEPIARNKGVFGMFKSECKAPASGTLETISKATGQVMIRGESIPVQVKAFLPGKVTEVLPEEGVVIENQVTLIQGIFGVGGETSGPIAMACDRHDQRLEASMVDESMQGAIVVGGARVTSEAIARAREVGVAAVVSGGIDDADLKDILGYDLGVAITGTERIGLTVIITEGFGDISMARRTHDLLKARSGDSASVNGATQIRAGVMRPEILIPVGDAGVSDSTGSTESGVLELGTPVRVIRDPHFGLIGTVASLPEAPQVLGSGSKSRVLEVSLETGEVVTVPRANVELIET
ncbi:MAG: hypothetical protein VYB77_07315 [Planctomycetota bacterium]|nr:hypothetical protein [Planctomycetota bacterium]